MADGATVKAGSGIMGRLQDYLQLMKPNLSFMVVFSSVIGYLIAPNSKWGIIEVLVLFLGGFFVTGGANTINQILEKDTDKIMKRTSLRPLPDQRITVKEAWIVALVTGIAGVLLLGIYFNFLTGVLSATSLMLYSFAYTPMKRINSVAVLIGAIPGSLPPLLGWVAATGSIDIGGMVLFMVQFFWQFPHLWAIAWVGYDDYKAVGIKMLPSAAGRTRFTGLMTMFYSLVLIPLAVLANLFHVTGKVGMFIGVALGIFYFLASFNFYKKNDFKSAKQLMYASFIYLPVILLAFLLG